MSSFCTYRLMSSLQPRLQHITLGNYMTRPIGQRGVHDLGKKVVDIHEDQARSYRIQGLRRKQLYWLECSVCLWILKNAAQLRLLYIISLILYFCSSFWTSESSLLRRLLPTIASLCPSITTTK